MKKLEISDNESPQQQHFFNESRRRIVDIFSKFFLKQNEDNDGSSSGNSEFAVKFLHDVFDPINSEIVDQFLSTPEQREFAMDVASKLLRYADSTPEGMYDQNGNIIAGGDIPNFTNYIKTNENWLADLDAWAAANPPVSAQQPVQTTTNNEALSTTEQNDQSTANNSTAGENQPTTNIDDNAGDFTAGQSDFMASAFGTGMDSENGTGSDPLSRYSPNDNLSNLTNQVTQGFDAVAMNLDRTTTLQGSDAVLNDLAANNETAEGPSTSPNNSTSFNEVLFYLDGAIPRDQIYSQIGVDAAETERILTMIRNFERDHFTLVNDDNRQLMHDWIVDQARNGTDWIQTIQNWNNEYYSANGQLAIHTGTGPITGESVTAKINALYDERNSLIDLATLDPNFEIDFKNSEHLKYLTKASYYTVNLASEYKILGTSTEYWINKLAEYQWKSQNGQASNNELLDIPVIQNIIHFGREGKQRIADLASGIASGNGYVLQLTTDDFRIIPTSTRTEASMCSEYGDRSDPKTVAIYYAGTNASAERIAEINNYIQKNPMTWYFDFYQTIGGGGGNFPSAGGDRGGGGGIPDDAFGSGNPFESLHTTFGGDAVTTRQAEYDRWNPDNNPDGTGFQRQPGQESDSSAGNDNYATTNDGAFRDANGVDDTSTIYYSDGSYSTNTTTVEDGQIVTHTVIYNPDGTIASTSTDVDAVEYDSGDSDDNSSNTRGSSGQDSPQNDHLTDSDSVLRFDQTPVAREVLQSSFVNVQITDNVNRMATSQFVYNLLGGDSEKIAAITPAKFNEILHWYMYNNREQIGGLIDGSIPFRLMTDPMNKPNGVVIDDPNFHASQPGETVNAIGIDTVTGDPVNLSQHLQTTGRRLDPNAPLENDYRRSDGSFTAEYETVRVLIDRANSNADHINGLVAQGDGLGLSGEFGGVGYSTTTTPREQAMELVKSIAFINGLTSGAYGFANPEMIAAARAFAPTEFENAGEAGSLTLGVATVPISFGASIIKTMVGASGLNGLQTFLTNLAAGDSVEESCRKAGFAAGITAVAVVGLGFLARAFVKPGASEAGNAAADLGAASGRDGAAAGRETRAEFTYNPETKKFEFRDGTTIDTSGYTSMPGTSGTRGAASVTDDASRTTSNVTSDTGQATSGATDDASALGNMTTGNNSDPIIHLDFEVDYLKFTRGEVKPPIEGPIYQTGMRVDRIQDAPQIPDIIPGGECGARAIELNNILTGQTVAVRPGAYGQSDFARSFGWGAIKNHETQDALIAHLSQSPEGSTFLIGIRPRDMNGVGHVVNAQIVEGQLVIRDAGFAGRHSSSDMTRFTSGHPENYEFYSVNSTVTNPDPFLNMRFSTSTISETGPIQTSPTTHTTIPDDYDPLDGLILPGGSGTSRATSDGLATSGGAHTNASDDLLPPDSFWKELETELSPTSQLGSVTAAVDNGVASGSSSGSGVLQTSLFSSILATGFVAAENLPPAGNYVNLLGAPPNDIDPAWAGAVMSHLQGASKNSIVFDAHSSGQFLTDHRGQEPRQIPILELVQMIKNNPNYNPEAAIVLNACHTGEIAQPGQPEFLAQALSRYLPNKIIAPNGTSEYNPLTNTNEITTPSGTKLYNSFNAFQGGTVVGQQ